MRLPIGPKGYDHGIYKMYGISYSDLSFFPIKCLRHKKPNVTQINTFQSKPAKKTVVHYVP